MLNLFGVTFLDLPVKQVLGATDVEKSGGIEDLPSPNHCVGWLYINGKWVIIDMHSNSTTFTPLKCLETNDKEDILTLSTVIHGKTVLDKIYDTTNKLSVIGELTHLAKKDLRLYGRPMYCHNFLIQLIGLDIGQVITTLQFKKILLRGKTDTTNFNLLRVIHG